MTPKTVDDLAADPRNPRAIDGVARAGLTASVRKFGDLAGIVWNTRTRTLVTGHQRVDALRARGAVLTGEGADLALVDPDGERFPIRIVDWPEAKARAALLTANNPSIQGEFTRDAIAMLEELANTNPVAMDDLDLSDLALDSLGDSLDAMFAPPKTKTVEFKDAEDAASKTNHVCPKCGYEWSGPAKAAEVPADEQQ